MGDRWVRGIDGASMIRVEEILGLRVNDGFLEALNRAGGSVAVAEGSTQELSAAERDLMRLMQSTDESSGVISAVRHAQGVGWAFSEGAGSDSGSVEIKAMDKEAWLRDNRR